MVIIYSLSSGSVEHIITLKLFIQLSSAMQAQPSAQDISFLLQIHIAPLHADNLQLHVVSSSKPFGAESLVIRFGLNVSFIVSYPLSVGKGSAWNAASAFFQISV